jgi:hypothetical protein
VVGLALVVGVALGVAIVLPVTTMFDAWTGPPLPSDQQLIQRFAAHQQWFEQLVAMYRADPQVVTDPAHANSTNSTRFEALMERLGVDDVEVDSGTLEITMASQGLVTSGSSKGYAYAKKPPSPLVAHVGEEAGPNVGVSGTRYRHLEGDWYLFLAWD